MFLRFVTTQINDCSRQPKGLFYAVHEFLDEGDLSHDERALLEEPLDWFNENLPGPGKYFDPCRAVFWFKSQARECIGRMWDLANVLRLYDYFVEVHKCGRLGNIIFEDDFQVAAYPSRKDGRITIM